MRRARRGRTSRRRKASTPPCSQERHLLGVAEVGVGLVLDDGGPAVEGGGEEAAQGVGVEGFLVDPLDYGRRGLGARTPCSLSVLISLAV